MISENSRLNIVKNLIKVIVNLVTLSVNSLKRFLHFKKVVIIADSDNWISVSYDLLCIKFLFSRYVVARIPFVPRKKHNNLNVDENFRGMGYKGINLYQVSEYNICVDLEVFPSKICFVKEAHRAAISKWFALSVECIDFFEKLVLQRRPVKILISQGHNYDAAIVRALSCLYAFKVVAVENTFNKEKIVWDDISGITVNKNQAKNYYWKYCDFVSKADADCYVRGYLDNIKKLKAQEHQTPVDVIPKSSKKTILFIGQVYSDSSVLFGINDFPCPVSIVEQLVDYCIANYFHLNVKLHPKEAIGNDILDRPYNNLTYRKILAREGLLKKMTTAGFVLDKDRYDTYALIDGADVCVTVNSQAGLEALVKGKNVIVCGQGYYTGLGFTFEALNGECLTCFLDLVLKRGVTILNRAEINKFFYIIADKYFVNRSEKSIKSLILIRL